ncbi:formate--tetrahydrofolate ligase [Ammoniphilus oxalaticus]|uniref:Formate--tetrahydrofolate ligase n=1 Tax=Ammoniphilus oxalaticus TaxID=66863 RepID=A0A419SL48_9BACL|nr:formate--tetrahydrofolate ligase [Ammoniphilus oxalaticus]RKD24705.1 formate--tetrahydrofolate ligase [Ammoniphilus oxalaticus]
MTTESLSDIQIAQAAEMKPISDIARNLDLNEDHWDAYGKYKAKLNLSVLDDTSRKDGKLILVTAINPTSAGEGKTTMGVGLSQALNRIGKRTVLALREPSLGPNFGLKGGAAGGGYSQVLPMEDINLHFTGDLHAITTAHNLLATLIDNHIFQGNELNIDSRQIIWKRVLDMSDRALRNITIGLGGRNHGIPREDGFDITAASEIMAILCLAEDLKDLENKLKDMLIAYTFDNQPVYVGDLKAQGAMAIVLKEAIKPNLVQTLENTPAIIHGGPFANIAHGCNSLLATRMALKLGEYAVTEAGFGVDLGAEKFIDIKCRKGELQPSAVVVVATIRALKMHGGVEREHLGEENLAALEAGFANLERHAETLRGFGLPFIVAINRFSLDTQAEVELLSKLCEDRGMPFAEADVWGQGGAGGEDLAHKLVEIVEGNAHDTFKYLYDVEDSVEDKLHRIVTEVYGGLGVKLTAQAQRQLQEMEAHGWDKLPICMAKTPLSLSDDPTQKGRPTNFHVTVREFRPSLGAGFIVALTGNVLTMPGLPKVPAALNMGLDEEGNIYGLF